VAVPLSEREQKILEEIERDLYREDPGFARGRRTGPRLPTATRARLGVVLFAAGLVSLFAFFAKQWLALGVIAFGAMVAGVVLIAGSVRTIAGEAQPRERVSALFKRWEDRFRQRYKGR
jgi:hypothetical protein